MGWSLLGGLDGKGNLGKFECVFLLVSVRGFASSSPSHCTAYDRTGVSFEEFLANKLGLTVNGLLTVFDNFVGSSFGCEHYLSRIYRELYPNRSFPVPARPLEASTSGISSAVGGPASSRVPVEDAYAVAASTLVDNSPPPPAPAFMFRSPHTPVFETPVKTLVSFSSSANSSPSDDSLGLLSAVAADALLVSSPASCNHESTHTPPSSTTRDTTVRNQQPTSDSPRVVFGPPPPRVLTTAPEKPPAKKYRGRATVPHVRRGGSRKNGTGVKMRYGTRLIFMLCRCNDTSFVERTRRARERLLRGRKSWPLKLLPMSLNSLRR